MHISKTIIQTLHNIYSDPDTNHVLAAPSNLHKLIHSQIKKLTGLREQIGDISLPYICITISPEDASDSQDCIMVEMGPFFQNLFHCDLDLRNTYLSNGRDLPSILQQINTELNTDEAPTLSSALRM